MKGRATAQERGPSTLSSEEVVEVVKGQPEPLVWVEEVGCLWEGEGRVCVYTGRCGMQCRA